MRRPYKLRHASLDDAAEISEIHRSYVDRWYRKLDNEQCEVPYRSLSLSERWGFGGPWMSVETCSVHLNNLLLQHQFPIVACEGDRPVGEMELFLGDEGVPYSQNMHIGLLYVMRGHTGQGIGSALVDKAFKLAEGQGCDTITVASSQANEGFYKRCGFERTGTMVELEAATKDYGVDISPMPPPLNVWSFARGMPMLLGRYQSSAFHLFEQFDAYAIPEFLNLMRDRVFVAVNGHPSMVVLVKFDAARADVYGWSGGAGAEELTLAVLALLHNDGIKYASILLTSDDYYAVADKLDAAVKGSRSTLLRCLK
jgi:ribosomal protein S18 acetylase RimI-like enzyme